MVRELELASNDVRGAYARATVMRTMLNNHLKSSMDATIVGFGYAIATSRYFDGDSVTPQCYCCTTTTGEMFLFVAGIANVQQGQQVWNWYTGPYSSLIAGQPGGVISPTIAFQNVLFRCIQGNNVGQRLFSVGYSWGGVVAYQGLGAMAGLTTPSSYRSITTFGSPKPFVIPDSGSQSWTDATQWFNSDDAVPLVPPTISSLQRFMAGLSTQQGRRLASFERFESNISITQTSTLIPSALPTDSPIPQATQVGNWLATSEAGVLSPHSISVYEARLRLAVLNLPPAQSVISVPAQPETVHAPANNLVVRARNGFVQTIFNDATRQNAVPVAIPSSNVWYAARTGKIWYVYFGGVQVAMAPKKRRARALANLGNAFCRKLQNEGVVNAGNLASQFVAYLQAASDPAGGFVPVMNIAP